MKLHVVEPTLQNEAGHCAGYVTSLLAASKEMPLELELWIGKHARSLFAEAVIHPIFIRCLRKFQLLLVYWYLLHKQQAIFVPTCGRLDLQMLCFLLGKRKDSKLFLHFHQFKVTPKKLAFLQKVAHKHPEFNILATTQNILNIFSASGFKNCATVPCPTYQRKVLAKPSGMLQKLLFAGVARKDKGFHRVVDLVAYLQSVTSSVTIVLQLGHGASGKYSSSEVKCKIKELLACEYPYVTTYPTTLSPEVYQELFTDAICLQLYDSKAYADKFSGITLDALYGGCPILTTDHTWIAATVRRFNAGMVISDTNPQVIYTAIQTMRTNFAELQKNALLAGEVLRVEHDPHYTLTTILGLKHEII